MSDHYEERKSASEEDSASDEEEKAVLGDTDTAQGIDTALKLAQHTQLDGWRAALGPNNHTNHTKCPRIRETDECIHLERDGKVHAGTCRNAAPASPGSRPQETPTERRLLVADAGGADENSRSLQ